MQSDSPEFCATEMTARFQDGEFVVTAFGLPKERQQKRVDLFREPGRTHHQIRNTDEGYSDGL
jgi:hypothetical protein